MSVIEDTRDIYQRAIDAWGEESQIDMGIEECGELIVALSKLGRSKGVRASRIEAAIDEIADVTIMMRQLRIVFGAEDVDKRIAFKLARLEQLIADTGDK